MKVEVIWDGTAEHPERSVALAARNDYYDGNVWADSYEEVMDSVEVNNTMPLSFEEFRDWDELDQKTASLIYKLLKQEHYGPFEHPSMMLHVEGMSRVTMAQLTRHRHMSFDIQSMRYVNFSDASVATPKSLTDPHHFSRDDGMVEMSERTRRRMEAVFEQQVEQAIDAYQNMTEAGVPAEDARYILPLGTTVNVTFSGNLRTLLHVLNMRGKANAQWEIRDLCDAVGDHLDDWAPITAKYFEEFGPFKLGM